MRNRSGPPVSGDDFAFRERELRFAEQALLDGNSILLFGLRRIGKTSLLQELKRRLEADGRAWCCLVDVQDKESASEFFLELLDALPATAGQALGKWIGKARTLPNSLWSTLQKRVRKGSFGGAGIELDKDILDYWKPLADAVEKTVPGLDRPVVLLIDELPFFIENLHARGEDTALVKQVLATLRSWRHAGVPMALAGSISIDQLLEDLGVSNLVLNDVSRLELHPLPREEAREMLRRLATAKDLAGWDDTTIDAVLDRLDDWFPFFLQCAFHHLQHEEPGDGFRLEEIFARHIEPDLQRSFFAQFDDRLTRRFPEKERKAAEQVLNLMARGEPPSLAIGQIKKIASPHVVDLTGLVRRLEVQQFIRPVAGKPGHYEFPFRLVRRWRQARGGA
ncbi:AAA family ATPase [Marinimicrococcus flavescens]|uniref:AAA family ATPase n=1 Tax=Marinimicrococcus flavescens TaxID=3031815 RepID=A0AAP3V0L0_9PROT|nr:AAA family ATPase [Marinimicrococcus flavescens]